MPRLEVKSDGPGSREILLRPGANLLGRGGANDFQIDDPSVSTLHCEIVVTDGATTVKDLGSTNGTFINHAPVKEAALQSGQILHLGTVEMRYDDDAQSPMFENAGLPAQSSALAAATTAGTGPRMCKHHPKAFARFFCGQCRHAFCELCVATRNVGGVSRKFCRKCGAELDPLKVHIERPVEISFFKRLPGAFAYPFHGSGVLVLIVGMLLFAGLRFAGGAIGLGSFRGMTVGLIMQVFLGGYLFAYLQNIIQSTIAEDKEMPDLPGMSNFAEDILMPFLRLLGLSLLSFAPMIFLEVWFLSQHQTIPTAAILSAAVFGCIYFPMAFLAVATLDSVAAANPLVVVPSMCRVPREYVVTVVLLATVFGFRVAGDETIKYLFGPTALLTHSMAQLLGMFAARVFWSFVSLYLLTVTMRILGLLYLTKKDELGWHSQ
jgi:hypothetical protein